MRSFLLPVAVILSMGGASLAMAAATTTEGVIKSVDMAAHTVTLADGITYALPASFKEVLKAGEKVSIVWDMKGKIYEASEVTVVKS